jgi:hypothetical protein
MDIWCIMRKMGWLFFNQPKLVVLFIFYPTTIASSSLKWNFKHIKVGDVDHNNPWVVETLMESQKIHCVGLMFQKVHPTKLPHHGLVMIMCILFWWRPWELQLTTPCKKLAHAFHYTFQSCTHPNCCHKGEWWGRKWTQRQWRQNCAIIKDRVFFHIKL